MVFKVKRQLSNKTSQGNLSVCAYFTSLKKLWDKIELLRLMRECQCGAISNVIAKRIKDF